MVEIINNIMYVHVNPSLCSHADKKQHNYIDIIYYVIA